MKALVISLLALLLVACQSKPLEEEVIDNSLPKKDSATSVLMNDSPITTRNLDDYLFRDDTIYIDTRSFTQFNEEGHVAGFINIPFYDVLVDYNFKNNVLFTMDKIFNEDQTLKIGLGDVGSFISNYNEAEEYIYQMFPRNKNIIFISTAGVEASYLMNLLIQLGYDGDKLYNAGPFTNGIGQNIPYRSLEEAKHLVEGQLVFNRSNEITWPSLTLKD